jgi:hypothetical protein
MIFFGVNGRKANIPIVLLVIGVFVLCGLALLTFFVSSFAVGNSFVGVNVLQELNTAVDEYLFYKNQGVSDSLNENYFEIIEKDGKKYFYYEKSSMDFSFSKLKNERKLLFSVEYLVPS